MTAKQELITGLVLWGLGVAGCILALYFITRHLAEVLIIFGSSIAVGICFTGCGALDLFVDDFHDDIKKEWEGGKETRKD